MELARQERELTKPKNWGAVAFQNIFNRQQEIKNGTAQPKVLGLDSRVRNVLEKNPTIRGPLDISPLLSEFTEEELIQFIQYFPQLEILIMQRWMKISSNFLRCISITISETLIELDLCYSGISTSHLEILLIRTTNLQIMRLDECPLLDTVAISTIVKLSYRTMKELYIAKGQQYLNNDSLLWIGGCSGVFSMSLSKLQVLDISKNEKVFDTGLIALSKGCKKLSFLNLEGCVHITDVGMIALAQGCKHMKLISIAYCNLITNKSLLIMGKYWKELQSLNLVRCVLITDKGMKGIALGCKALQAINCAGLVKITEETLFLLIDSCKGILTLNMTGCERITVNGLENAIQGLPYTENASHFFGFQPIDQHIQHKLQDNLLMISSLSKKLADKQALEQAQKQAQDRETHEKRLFQSACLIQQYLTRYKKRIYFYHLSIIRKQMNASMFIQRIYRGYLGRELAIQARKTKLEFYAKSPFAQIIQCHLRGYLSRLQTSRKVCKRIQEMYQLRKHESRMAIVVKIQTMIRLYLAKQYVSTYRILYYRAKQHAYDAILILQMLVRRYLAKMTLYRKQTKHQQLLQARETAGLKIKMFVTEGMRRYRDKLTGEGLKRYFLKKWRACECIQRIYRGYKLREILKQAQITKAVRYVAAREIQRIYRGSRILYYKDLRLNILSAFILDRFYLERLARIEQCQKRYQSYLTYVRQDSASEPDTEDETDEINPYVKHYDVKKKMFYYVNYITNEITYDEPAIPLAHEKDMLHKRVKVYWILQQQWYEGYITKYHKRKKRHRIEYDDGDHEWIRLYDEKERIQVYDPQENVWIAYAYYQSAAKLHEIEKMNQKIQHNEYKAKAYRDATQWKAFVDDKNNSKQVMFLSEITGELRTGVNDALQWIVQDDGYGFPCFFHQITSQIVYEDPRFTYELDEDSIQQRKYVLSELRYAVYICQSLYDEYQQLVLNVTNNNNNSNGRALLKIKIKIKNSPKPIHLASFLIRAKGLFEPVSIVDKPLDIAIQQELEYADWLNQRMSEIIDQTEAELRKRKDKKKEILTSLTENVEAIVYCRYCKRETQKHLAYCPTCGKPQVFL